MFIRMPKELWQIAPSQIVMGLLDDLGTSRLDVISKLASIRILSVEKVWHSIGSFLETPQASNLRTCALPGIDMGVLLANQKL